MPYNALDNGMPRPSWRAIQREHSNGVHTNCQPKTRANPNGCGPAAEAHELWRLKNIAIAVIEEAENSGRLAMLAGLPEYQEYAVTAAAYVPEWFAPVIGTEQPSAVDRLYARRIVRKMLAGHTPQTETAKPWFGTGKD
jgi:hypothetical protein